MILNQITASCTKRLPLENSFEDDETPSIMAFPPFVDPCLEDLQFFPEKMTSCEAEIEWSLQSYFKDACI